MPRGEARQASASSAAVRRPAATCVNRSSSMAARRASVRWKAVIVSKNSAGDGPCGGIAFPDSMTQRDRPRTRGRLYTTEETRNTAMRGGALARVSRRRGLHAFVAPRFAPSIRPGEGRRDDLPGVQDVQRLPRLLEPAHEIDGGVFRLLAEQRGLVHADPVLAAGRRRVQGHGGTNQSLQGFLVRPVTLAEIDRATACCPRGWS